MLPQRDILVVEDDDAIIGFLVELFIDEGYDTRTASTGESALAAVATTHPTLILMDLCLPDMDGVHVLQQLRTSAQYTGPLLVMSGRSEDIGSLLCQGATAYLLKPFELDDLLSKVQQYIGPSQARAIGE